MPTSWHRHHRQPGRSPSPVNADHNARRVRTSCAPQSLETAERSAPESASGAEEPPQSGVWLNPGEARLALRVGRERWRLRSWRLRRIRLVPRLGWIRRLGHIDAGRLVRPGRPKRRIGECVRILHKAVDARMGCRETRSECDWCSVSNPRSTQPGEPRNRPSTEGRKLRASAQGFVTPRRATGT